MNKYVNEVLNGSSLVAYNDFMYRKAGIFKNLIELMNMDNSVKEAIERIDFNNYIDTDKSIEVRYYVDDKVKDRKDILNIVIWLYYEVFLNNKIVELFGCNVRYMVYEYEDNYIKIIYVKE